MMKKKIFNILISLSLIFVIVMSGLISVNAYENHVAETRGHSVVGTVSFEKNESLDLTCLKINVFQMALKNKATEMNEYEHINKTTVSPDINGKIQFEKPSEYCYVEIETESVPSGFGVDKTDILMTPNENNFSLELSSVANFTYDFFNNQVIFYSERGKSLFANNKYTIRYDEESVKNAFLNGKSVDIACDFGSCIIKKQQSIEQYSLLDKINWLFEKQFITEEEKIKLYIKNINDGHIEDSDDYFYAVSLVNAFGRGDELLDNGGAKSVTDPYMITYTDEATYTYRFYTIHYESGTISDQYLYALGIYLNHAKNVLCYVFEFDAPTLKPGETTYHVYLDSNASYGGRTIKRKSGSTVYSYIDLGLSDGNGSISYKVLGTACHEVMHTVQMRYVLPTSNDTEVKYFNEAVANVLKVELVENCEIKDLVDKFQNSPELSLFSSPSTGLYANRCYGMVLFPLCIEQEFSDLNTIKEIYEELRLQGSNLDVKDAIDSVLQNYNSSLSNIYAQCALYNYNIQHYYNRYENDWQTCAKLSAYTTSYTNYSSPSLSSRYFDITDNAYGGFAISFGSSNDMVNACVQSVTNNNGVFTKTQHIIPATNITLIYYNPEGQTRCAIISNDSWTDSINYSVRGVIYN